MRSRMQICGATSVPCPQEPDVDASTTPTTPGRTAPGRPPLRRPREGRVLGGVAAGLADHLGVDVALVRLLIVLATIITQGFGLLAYIIAVFVIPSAEPGESRPRAARRDPALGGRSPAFWGGIALVVLGVWWLLAVTPFRLGFLPGASLGGLAAPLLLIGVGLALWVTGDRAGPASTPSSSPWPSSPWSSSASAATSAAGPPATPAAAAPSRAPGSAATSPTFTNPDLTIPQEPAMTPSTTTTPGATATGAAATST